MEKTTLPSVSKNKYSITFSFVKWCCTILFCFGISFLGHSQNLITNPGLNSTGANCSGADTQHNDAPDNWSKISSPDRSTETHRAFDIQTISHGPSPDGGCYYGFRGTSFIGQIEGISQDIFLAAGNYNLSFDHLVDTFFGSICSDTILEISLNGTVVATAPTLATQNVWARPNLSFNVATSGTFTLGIYATATVSSGFDCTSTYHFVDDIVLVEVCTISDISLSNISSCNNNGTPNNPSDDFFTADVTVDYAIPPASGTLDVTGDGTASVAVSSLGSATSHTFTNVTLPADGGAINLTATFSADTGCTYSENAGTAPTSCSGPADLSLTKTLNDTSPYSPGDTVTYDIVVTNNGPDTANNVTVTDNPTNITITGVVGGGGGCTGFPGCNIGTLANGASVTLTVTATIDNVGNFTNEATVSADETDPDTSNNTDDASDFTDNDNDGVPDITDLDDDNDGILDTVEGYVAGGTSCTNTTQAVSSVIQAESNISAGTNFVAINDGVATADDGVVMNNTAHHFVIDLGQVYEPMSVITLDIWGNSTATRTVVNSETPGGTYLPSGGTNQVTTQVNINGTSSYTYTLANATRYIQIDMTARTNGRTEWIEATITTTCTTTPEVTSDTDGDGVFDHLDLDSDNDGIPDNIEAQTTQDYTAPNADNAATYLANNGVNSAYLGGLTPVNTDSPADTDPDYLDLDSDEDGIFDIAESGLANNDSDNDGDTDGTVGTNGLDNDATIESADDYTDVNGLSHDGTNFLLADSDNDTNANGTDAAPLGVDLDFRDNSNDECNAAISSNLDTDGDGVTDICDIDDDNDGVIDEEECTRTVESNPGDLTVIDNIGTQGLLTFISDGVLNPNSGVVFNSDGDYVVIDLGSVFPTGKTIRFFIYPHGGSQNNLDVEISEVPAGSFISEGGDNQVELNYPSASTPNLLYFKLSQSTQFLQFEMTNRIGGRIELVEVQILSDSLVCQDLDNDGIPEYLDTDSDNDGCPDATEADSSLATTSTLVGGSNGGSSDNLGIVVNTNGIPIAATGGITNGNEIFGQFANNRMLSAALVSLSVPVEDQTANEGNPVTFNTFYNAEVASSYLAGVPQYTADNSNNVRYQWYLGDPNAGGTIIAGETGPSLTITATPALDGQQYCVVTEHINNPCGQEIQCAVLNVINICTDEATTGTPTINDPDADGINNVCDLDDDNDGILDANEGYVTTTVTTSTDVDYSNVTPTTNTGTSSGILAEIAGACGDEPFVITYDFVTTGGDIPGLNPLNGGDRLQFDYATDNLSGTSQITYNFSEAVDVVLRCRSNLAGNENVTFITPYDNIIPGAGSTIVSTVPFVVWHNNNNSADTAFEFNQVTKIVIGVQGTGLGQAQRMSISNFTQVTTCLDTDADGVLDYLDLDSDNDGIPDNIEAQTTQNYIAPGTFTDNDNDGLNDIYDTNTTDASATASVGLIPVNTDSASVTDNPDYLDLDSDEDGVFDIAESGLANNDGDNDGDTDGTVGTNGLDNDAAIESVDDYTDVNGLSHDGTNFLLADSDNDTNANGTDAAPLGVDLDFRDNSNDECDASISDNLDTDGDGVTDICDLDDDNDGVLDEVENLRGTSNNPFTSLGQARNVTNAGVYFFNLNGNTFSTYVDDSGYVQIAIDFGNGSGNLPQGTALTNASRGILSPSILATLTDAASIRISHSGGNLDVTTSNASLLSRITTNTTLHQGTADNAINDDWTGNQASALTVNATCSSTSGTGLHQNIVHVCGVGGAGFHWIPSTGVQRIRFSSGAFSDEIGNTESFTLWVQAASVLIADVDSDLDGIINSLDLDSDNDGIPDNIEAQTTQNYTAPNADNAATYLANNGVNSAYLGGLTPVNTDSASVTDNPD
ncbi:DUF7507 domain-containing protein, partial [Kordia sp.]|uniref:DUF7507 domain-containing protein n=1 Tax=Kordia sp. TaxID=1965332 RepID=UPI003D6A9568